MDLVWNKRGCFWVGVVAVCISSQYLIYLDRVINGNLAKLGEFIIFLFHVLLQLTSAAVYNIDFIQTATPHLKHINCSFSNHIPDANQQTSDIRDVQKQLNSPGAKEQNLQAVVYKRFLYLLPTFYNRELEV